MLEALKSDEYEWVDLSTEITPKTPHYSGFSDLSIKDILTFEEHNVSTKEYSMVSQYGTHIDPPSHFIQGARPLDQISIKECILPLCVVDVSAQAAANPDYAITVDDLTKWEEKHGKFPAGSMVAMRTDWYKREGEDFFNKDENGDCHYPGWSKEALVFLCEKRGITAVGHEPPDTDPAEANKVELWGAERYILGQDKFQIEILRNLDLLPPTGTIITIGFPKIPNSPGFTARCLAIFKK